MKFYMLFINVSLFLVVAVASVSGQRRSIGRPPDQNSGLKSGPEIGEKIPNFNLPDQNGRMHDFASIAGPNGAVILFHRSADW